MSRYDRQYDFGLRGYRQTTRPMMDGRYGGSPYDQGYRAGFDERAYPEQRYSNRVTARYNMDYVTGPSGERYERAYGPEDRYRMVDPSTVRQPYFTYGGSRTNRGIPIAYDYRDYRGRFSQGI